MMEWVTPLLFVLGSVFTGGGISWLLTNLDSVKVHRDSDITVVTFTKVEPHNYQPGDRVVYIGTESRQHIGDTGTVIAGSPELDEVGLLSTYNIPVLWDNDRTIHGVLASNAQPLAHALGPAVSPKPLPESIGYDEIMGYLNIVEKAKRADAEGDDGVASLYLHKVYASMMAHEQEITNSLMIRKD